MKGHFTKNQRMQLKGLICVLAVLLLLILMLGKLVAVLVSPPREEEESKSIPEVEVLRSVWLLGWEETACLVFCDGEELTLDLDMGLILPGEKEVVADITLTDGLVTDVRVKKEKIRDVVHSVGKDYVELETYGRMELAQDYRGYQIYGSLGMRTAGDLVIGYDFADFVLEDGKICGILFAREEAMETIRVLLKNSNYEGLYHDSLKITCDSDFTVKTEKDGKSQDIAFRAGEFYVIESGGLFGVRSTDRIHIIPEALTGKIYLPDLVRNHQDCGYRGTLEIQGTREGLVVVNTLPLEEYLYYVVPSEMPASYPMEALKAQAICARTYAYGNLLHAGYPEYGAHVDDSTSYQVYHNIGEQESTTAAVRETYGQILYDQDQVAQTFYYSTSCGMGTDAGVWKAKTAGNLPYLKGKKLCRSLMRAQFVEEDIPGDGTLSVPEFREESNGLWWMELIGSEQFGVKKPDVGFLLQLDMEKGDYPVNLVGAEYLLTEDADDFEVDQSWYRWIYFADSIDRKELQRRLKENTEEEVKDFQQVKGMEITARGTGGIADELMIRTDTGDYKVAGEHSIREVLCDGATSAIRRDGKTSLCGKLLPSAFFILIPSFDQENVVGYTLIGGGYGHGVGMSQNGAREMAAEDWTAREILGFFYEGCELTAVY